MDDHIIVSKSEYEKASSRPLIEMPSFDNVPDLLRDEPHWLNWIWTKQGGRQQWTKAPKCKVHGYWMPAKSTDPRTWTDFMSASLDAVLFNDRSATDERCGIGFALTKGITVIDLDDCRNRATGELTPEAFALIRTFNSYTEVSPSGTGVKIFLAGSKPGTCCRKGHIEIYETKRYVTVTGDIPPGVPRTIEAREEELRKLYAELFPPKPARVVVPHDHCRCHDHHHEHQPADFDDRELFEVIGRARNADKFDALWQGDTSGYKSPSDADYALARMLAFYCKADPARIESLMRMSGLVRDKWDSWRGATTYLRFTIDNAIANTNTFFTARACFSSIDEEIAGLDNLIMTMDIRGGDGASESSIKRVINGPDLSDLDSESTRRSAEETKAEREAQNTLANAAAKRAREEQALERCKHWSHTLQRNDTWTESRLLPVRCRQCDGCIRLKKRRWIDSLTGHFRDEPAYNLFCTFTFSGAARGKKYDKLMRRFAGHYFRVCPHDGADWTVIAALPAGATMPAESRLLTRDEAIKLMKDTIASATGKAHNGRFVASGKAWKLPADASPKQSKWVNVGSLRKALSHESIMTTAGRFGVSVETKPVPAQHHNRLSGHIYRFTFPPGWGQKEAEAFFLELGLEETLPSDEDVANLTRNMRDRQIAEEFVIEV